MSFELMINGVDRIDLLNRDKKWQITKRFGTERFSFAIHGKTQTGATYRPRKGDSVIFSRTGELLFGGKIKRTSAARLKSTPGTTLVTCETEDNNTLADRMYVAQGTFPSQDALVLFDYLITTYLAPLGVTNIGATSGGPMLPELKVEEPNITLRTILNRITDVCEWPWRINGLYDCALVEPGSLPGPVALTDTLRNAKLNPDVVREDEAVLIPNRLYMKLGVPTSGAKPLLHSETRIADGVQQAFPVNILPNRTRVAMINNTGGYIIGDTVIALDGITPGMVIRAGNSFTTFDQPSTFVVQTDATVDADGKVTVTIAPGFDDPISDDTQVTLSAETGIILEINGTDTDLFGSPWVWDEIEGGVVNPSAPPTAGDEIVWKSLVTHGGWARAWETSTPNPQAATGAFDRTVLIDGENKESEWIHFEAAVEYLRHKLIDPVRQKYLVKLTTQTPGWYPLLSATLSFPDNNVEGVHVVESVTISPTGAPSVSDDAIWYALECRKGDIVGKSSIDRSRPLQLGAQWGAQPPVAGCGDDISTVILSENFAAGASTAFGPASLTHWETPGDAADVNYPGLFVTEDAGINVGGGPSGENFLTLNTGADPFDDWVVAAAAWRGLGDSGSRFFGSSNFNAFKANRGRIMFDLRFDANALDLAYFHLLFQLIGVYGDAFHLAAYADDAGPLTVATATDIIFELQYWAPEEGGGFDNVLNTTVVSKADLLAEGWQRWKVCWQCGTYSWDGIANDGSVASDGWIKVYRGDVLMFNLTNIPMMINEGAYESAGNDHSNYVREVAIGLYGFAGDTTNIQVKAEGPASETIPAIVQISGTEGSGEGTTPLDHDMLSDVVAGHQILAVVTMYGYKVADPGVVTDSQGNTYTLVVQDGSLDYEEGARIYKAIAGSSGPLTITYTPAVNEWVSLGGIELDGPVTVDVTGSNINTGLAGGFVHTSGLPDTTVVNCLVMAVFANRGGDATATAASGFTMSLLVDPENDQGTLAVVTGKAIGVGPKNPTMNTAIANSHTAVSVALSRA